MTSLYIYIDESGDLHPNATLAGDRYFSLGSVISNRRIPHAKISAAMAVLKATSNRTRSDNKALERKFFHASKNGPGAHGALLTEINKLDIEFEANIFDKLALKNDISSPRAFHEHAVILSNVFAVGIKVSAINIYVAKRAKTFIKYSADTFTKQFYDGLTGSSARTPLLPVLFPEIRLYVVDSNDPGVQIADFLLWSVNRKFRPQNRDSTWYDRISVKPGIQIDINIKDYPIQTKKVTVNLGNSAIKRLSDYDFNINELTRSEMNQSQTQFLNTLLIIENSIVWSHLHLPKKYYYLKSIIKPSLVKLSGKEKLSYIDLKEICFSFLLLFDTVKIMHNQSRLNKLRLLKAKRISAIVYLQQEVRWARISSYWSDIHSELVKYHIH